MSVIHHPDFARVLRSQEGSNFSAAGLRMAPHPNPPREREGIRAVLPSTSPFSFLRKTKRAWLLPQLPEKVATKISVRLMVRLTGGGANVSKPEKENGMPAFAGMTLTNGFALKKNRHIREGGCPISLVRLPKENA